MSPEPVSYPYAPDLIPTGADRGEGMWRWRRLLPLDGWGRYPLQIGGTPLVASTRLRQETGIPGLVVKDETRTPTGSNKDRATALCVVDAARLGATAIACASSGNVACSLATGAASMGVPAYIFVSAAEVSPEKVAFMRAFGATVFLVDGTYEEAYRLCDAACARFGWYNRNTASNPLALQAKKTVAFEVWEALGRRMPDVAYLPVGDGVTLAAFVHGCEELLRCGVADRLPRVVGVQASGAAPLVEAAGRGASTWSPLQPSTIADGIGIGNPFYGREALEAVRRTGGDWVSVSDDQLRAAIALLARAGGILAEPAGAASLAGALADRARPAGEGGTVLVTDGPDLYRARGGLLMRWDIVKKLARAGRHARWIARTSAVLVGVAVVVATAGPIESDTAETAQPCRIAAAPEHARGWRAADLGCPTEVASPIEAVEQFFELGIMLWRSDFRTIYALTSQGSTAVYASDRPTGFDQAKVTGADDPAWRSFPDYYHEGQPEYAGHAPPDERFQEPVRGFGKVWREQLGGPSARLGWATTYERRVWAAVQSFERGLILRTDAGRVYVLRNNGTWVSYRS